MSAESGEDAGHGSGYQHHSQPEQAGVCAAQGQLEPESLLYAGLFAGPEVEAHHRLAALAHALNGQCAQLKALVITVMAPTATSPP